MLWSSSGEKAKDRKAPKNFRKTALPPILTSAGGLQNQSKNKIFQWPTENILPRKKTRQKTQNFPSLSEFKTS